MYTEMTDDYSFARTFLTPGETILWRGKPVRGHLFGPQDVFMIPFSIMWFAFAINWESGVITTGAPLFFKLWGIPFILVGLYITVGRFFHMAYLRKRTAYVITNQKLIRKRGGKIDMLDAKTMPAIHVTARTDGTGTIRFGQAMYYYRGRQRYTNQTSWGPNDYQFTLENIPDVGRVQQILHSIAGN